MPSPKTLEIIERLIGFDTVSHNSNLALIDYIADYLAGFGVVAEIIRDPVQNKANLYATIGPDDCPGVVLSGHTDVVPVTGQAWSRDPFTVHATDDRLFGRGTCDMKSFIAIALAQVPQFVAGRLATPVHLAFSYDEEIGCVGVQSLIESLRHQPIRPAACIVGEPTGMQVITAHKGKTSMRCHVTGKEAHSSQAHKGANAVEAAARIISRLADMASDLRVQGPYVAEMEPSYTTIHVGPVKGGEALNIIPNNCQFEFEIRYLPCADPQTFVDAIADFAATEIEPSMQKIASECGVEWEHISRIVALNGTDDSPAAALAKALTGANTTGKVAFGTEAGLFDEIDIPTVVCGPGSVDQAHKPDEFISFEQIDQCEAFMARLCERLTSGAFPAA